MVQKISKEVNEQANRLSKAHQKVKLTKEQNKQIIQGIEKGIADYKKQQSAKSRERDKQRKQQLKQQNQQSNASEEIKQQVNAGTGAQAYLPWGLLILSWIAFIMYYFLG